MKQHITIEQLDELSEKEKVRLREWWTDVYDEHVGDPWDEYDEMPVLSIGQMIEFLDEQKRPLHIHNKHVSYRTEKWNKDDGRWEVIYPRLEGDCYPPFEHKDELCDALWEAVKEKLNGKD